MYFPILSPVWMKACVCVCVCVCVVCPGFPGGISLDRAILPVKFLPQLSAGCSRNLLIQLLHK